MKIKNTFLAPCLVIVLLALVTSVRYIDPELLSKRNDIYLSFVIIQFLVLLLPAVLYIKLKGKGYGETVGMKMFAPDSIAFIIFCMFMLIAGSAAIRFVCEEIGIPRSDLILLRRLFPNTGTPDNPLFLLMAFALAPAISEEFIFRGVMISEYRSGGRVCAVLMSSLLFAFLHYGFENFILAVFVGATLAFAVYVTGSIWSAVAIRFIYNTYCIYLETQLFNVLDRPKNNIFMIFIFVGLFLLFLFFTLGCAEKMFYSYALENRETPERNDNFVYGKISIKSSLISLPFIFCILLYVITSL